MREPGVKKLPMARPSHTAICPVTTNSNSARQPTLPSFLKSPILATPATRLKKISGTTSILMKAMKISPMILMLSAPGPQTKPTITPRTSAAMTRCHSGMANQVFMFWLPYPYFARSYAKRGGKGSVLAGILPESGKVRPGPL